MTLVAIEIRTLEQNTVQHDLHDSTRFASNNFSCDTLLIKAKYSCNIFPPYLTKKV